MGELDFDAKRRRPAGPLVRIGSLLAELVQQAVRDGRWDVDEYGVAHKRRGSGLQPDDPNEGY